MGKIKIKYEDLKGYSNKQLFKARDNLKLLMMKNPKDIETGMIDKGRNPKEERKNLARINTLIRERGLNG